ALAMSQPATLAEQAMYKVTSKDGPSIVMRYTDPARRFTLEKRYTHDPELRGSFKVDITLTNTQKEAPLTDSLSVVMYGKMPASSGEWSLFNPIPDITEAVCFVDGGVERAGSDDAKENPKHTGAVVWGGVDSRYFTTTILSNKDTPFASCSFSLVDSEYLRTELGLGSFNLAPGQQQTWNLRSYVGPKSTEQMAAFGVDLERSIDYGIFEFLCRPIRWTLVLFYGWTGNWGIAIILLTIFLRTLLFPINHKSFKSMEGLRRIQEPMQEIREKYEHDQMKMQEEMMKLYKKENVSPFGCLPQLLQIPIFFAFYRTIYSSVELYHANFFGWYTDLSAPDPYFILPVLVGLAMVGQQFLMPQTAQNEQMKYMMYAMPVMFSVFTFVLPSGLALYIFVSVLLGILQQYYIRRTSDSQAEAKKA
ncbi:MAG: membrane protein insertase YidC, partial [Myxococcota bacterium]